MNTIRLTGQWFSCVVGYTYLRATGGTEFAVPQQDIIQNDYFPYAPESQ
ncbi:hypothetical protein ACFVYJ_04465 [Pontibacter sp. JAM-7]